MRGITQAAWAALAAAVVFAAPAAAKQPITIEVHAHYTEGPTKSSAFGCRFDGLKCGTTESGTATFTDTWQGRASYDQPSWWGTDGKLYYDGPDYFTGTIRGCGTGTIIIDDYDGYIDMTTPDPMTLGFGGYNTWQVRPGSGTGGLAGVTSGSGVNNWTMYPHKQLPDTEDFGIGDFTGKMTCMPAD